jgi:F-type H+-transporting ATPase subunit epsilon
MAETFHFELVSPERLLSSGEVEQVVVPGTEGEMTVMARHAPMMTTLKPGVISIVGGGPARHVFVRGGFAEMGEGGLTVLAEQAVAMEEMSRARLDVEIEAATAERDAATDEAARTKAEEKLAHLHAIEVGV